jgi:hypothetical protein
LAKHFCHEWRAACNARRTKSHYRGGTRIGRNHRFAGDISGGTEVLGKRSRNMGRKIICRNQCKQQVCSGECGKIGQRGLCRCKRRHPFNGISAPRLRALRPP